MRIILVSVLLIGLFILLLQVVPPALFIPLYCLFSLAGIGYALWERRGIHARRTLLEEEYRAKRENARLRSLLQSSSRRWERVLIAELMSVDFDPFKHLVRCTVMSKCHDVFPLLFPD